MHVVASLRPVDTAALIGRHDAAFRACGGRPQECVYDQTRLVSTMNLLRSKVVSGSSLAAATSAPTTSSRSVLVGRSSGQVLRLLVFM